LKGFSGRGEKEGIAALKTRGKRIALIVTAIFLLIFDSMWLMACLFAVGQLYNTYDLKVYLSEAPIAVVILIGLFVAAVLCVVRAVTLKDKEKGNEDRGDNVNDSDVKDQVQS
jgi:hypothetical protein